MLIFQRYVSNILRNIFSQSLNQDVQAHENAIQSANAKAQELASKSPESKVISDTAQISEQYTNLQQVVKVWLVNLFNVHSFYCLDSINQILIAPCL